MFPLSSLGAAERTKPQNDESPNPAVRSGIRADGASRTRTGDLLGAIQALSQLSYSPEEGAAVQDFAHTAQKPIVAVASRLP